MIGYSENMKELYREPLTADQKTIIVSLGFAVPEIKKIPYGRIGCFGEIVVKLPCPIPEVAAILKKAGFRWDSNNQYWVGSDSTKEAVEIMQVLRYCDRRAFSDQVAGSQYKWASFVAGQWVCSGIRVQAWDRNY